MNPYLQSILANFSQRIAELEKQNKLLEEECTALRKQINELLNQG